MEDEEGGRREEEKRRLVFVEKLTGYGRRQELLAQLFSFSFSNSTRVHSASVGSWDEHSYYMIDSTARLSQHVAFLPSERFLPNHVRHDKQLSASDFSLILPPHPPGRP